MNDIKKRIDKLYEKYPNYICFSYTVSLNKNMKTEKWNIYTPVIYHNEFKDREKFIEFLDFLIKLGHENYKKMKLERLKESREYLKEELEDIEKNIMEYEDLLEN